MKLKVLKKHETFNGLNIFVSIIHSENIQWHTLRDVLGDSDQNISRHDYTLSLSFWQHHSNYKVSSSGRKRKMKEIYIFDHLTQFKLLYRVSQSKQLTRSCITCGSILGRIDIAFLIACTMSLGSGSASTIMSSGKT